jgi:adenosylmethionine---8-amino-7-oxononanoate aminotransferase
LLRTAPWNGGRVFFSDNGSTAVEVALKMAYQFWCHRNEPQRTLFIGFENAYHGDTFGAMAIGRDPLFFGTFEPLLFRAKQIPVSAEALEQVLREHGSQTAAVIIEPLVQGAGGMRMHSPQMLHELWSVTKRHGVLFIADEVMTCGRTGRFWAHEGIVPDLICAAKTLAGGVLSLAVTLASPEIVAAFDTADRTRTFFHGHSFTAHPLACAVAAENLRMMAEGDWLQQARRIEAYWQQSAIGLRALPNVIDVRITGTIVAVELNVPGGYLASIGKVMKQAALKKGVLLRPLGNVLYSIPPLCTSDGLLGQIIEASKTAIQAITEPEA